MAYIEIINEENAGEELKEIYAGLKKKRGKISNILSVQSLNPPAMKAHLDLYMSVMFNKSSIRRELCEMIAVVVSKANNCDYCMNHHIEALKAYRKDEKFLINFQFDYRTSGLENNILLVLEYAHMLTQEPEKISKDDIENLKEAGFSDEDILNINLIVSYFNFVNRIALGLGVEFTEEEMKGYNY